MGALQPVNAGDPIQSTSYNELTRLANAVMQAHGIGGATVSMQGGALTIGISGGVGMSSMATEYPAINSSEGPDADLGPGELCMVVRGKIQKGSIFTSQNSPNALVFEVVKFDTDYASDYQWAIVAQPMVANSNGNQGSIYLSGLIWVQAKLHPDWEEIWPVAKPALCGVCPADGERYFHRQQDGLWQVLAEEDGITNYGTLHWVLIRFEQPRYPLLYEATEDADEDTDTIVAKPCKSDGDLVDLETTFPTLAE